MIDRRDDVPVFAEGAGRVDMDGFRLGHWTHGAFLPELLPRIEGNGSVPAAETACAAIDRYNSDTILRTACCLRIFRPFRSDTASRGSLVCPILPGPQEFFQCCFGIQNSRNPRSRDWIFGANRLY